MADEAIIGAITAPFCVKCGAPACWATLGDPSSFRCSACDLAEEPMRGQPEMTPPEMVWENSTGAVQHLTTPSGQEIALEPGETVTITFPPVPGETAAYIAKLEAALAQMTEKAEKFMWQVRDTCARAEKAEAQLAAARAERDSMRFTDEKLEAALANAQQTIAAKDEIIRRLANERAALQSLVDEVRFPDADADRDARYVEMGDEFRFPAVAMKEGGWERATWADWSDDEESV